MSNTYLVGGMNIALQSKTIGEDYLETAGGAFRSLQFCDKLLNLIGTLGIGQDFCKEAALICNRGWTALSIPRIPGAFFSMKESIEALSKASTIPNINVRRYVNLVQTSASFAAVTTFAALPFMKAAGKVSHCAKLGCFGMVSASLADAFELEKNVEDLRKAHACLQEARQIGASTEVIAALKETRMLNLVKTAKSIVGIAGLVLAGGVFGFGALAFQGSAAFLAALSLAGTTLAIGAALYENSMTNGRVNFFNDKHVQYLSSQVA
jgi:hypothetical protein